ncbi:MAG: aldehyde dehydrogenase family protein [Gammaproteobacteria bacterium]|nr:aldehyde dehydrogenase family protein [Gammaproteobacteria bacterium]
MSAYGSIARLEPQPDVVGASELLERARRAGADWRRLSVAARVAVLRRFRHRLAADSLQLACRIRCRPVADTLTGELLPLLEACRFVEKRAESLLRPVRCRYRAGIWLRGTTVRVSREPYGTVLIVGPSNYGLMLPGIQALQALAAGNAVIVKPAPGTREALDELRKLLEVSGLPEGLLTISDESVATAEALIDGPIDKLVFTGSSAAGRSVLERAAANLVPATLELSGWDACIVLDSADIERAARAIAFALSFNSGRTCLAPRRILVSRCRYRSLIDRLTALLDRIGPVAFDPAGARAAGKSIAAAIEGGARLVSGALQPDGVTGPAVLVGVDRDQAIFNTEVFGPVAIVMAFDDPARAVATANATPYRLGATLFGSPQQTRALVPDLDAGVVMVNDAIVPAAHPALPIAARGASGHGATRGAEGLLEFTRPKAVASSTARRPLHLEPPLPQAEPVLAAYIEAAYGKNWVKRTRAAWRALVALTRGPTREKR